MWEPRRYSSFSTMSASSSGKGATFVFSGIGSFRLVDRDQRPAAAQPAFAVDVAADRVVALRRCEGFVFGAVLRVAGGAGVRVQKLGGIDFLRPGLAEVGAPPRVVRLLRGAPQLLVQRGVG